VKRFFAGSWLLIACFAVAQIAASADVARDLPDQPVVTTLAGTGDPGIADGPADRAEFEGPNGIAYDPQGNLYVADGPGQRIRKVDPAGTVTTVAGSGPPILFASGVAGGYRDGPGASAQFSEPVGVAVAPDGTLYVTDLLNHCIRAIKGGVVSTFAGSPARAGKADGPIATASFGALRGIAVDDGTIYVTDFPTGVRRITPDGVVTTMPVPEFAEAWNLTTYNHDGTDELIVAARYRVVVYDLKQNRVIFNFATNWPFGFLSPGQPSPSEGGEMTGPAMAIAAIDASEFVYADPVFSTIHLLQIPNSYTRVLGDQPLLNALKLGGGFRNGPLALYQQPTGVAVAPAGQIAVADTGNRRIRLLPPFDRQTAGTNRQQLPAAANAKVLRVALLGDSFVWSNVARGDSIAGILGDRLRRAQLPASESGDAEVYPIRQDGAQFSALAAFANGQLGDGRVDDVYLFVDATRVSNFGDVATSLRSLNARMHAAHTRLVVVLTPGGADLPSEMAYRKTFAGPSDPALAIRSYADAKGAARQAGVEVVDLWPAFFNNDAKPGFRPLYGAWDDHLTIFGNQLVASALADDLLHALAARTAR
jgi:SGNH hydrolase-like domain, acetyltransferase AlgX/NHL repeat